MATQSKNLKKITQKLPKKTTKKHFYKKSDNTRVRQVSEHRSFKLTKVKLKAAKPLPRLKQTIFQPLRLIFAHKKAYLLMCLIYAGLTFVLVNGIGQNFSLVETKNNLTQTLSTNSHDFTSSLALFSYLVGNFSSPSSEVTGVYKLLIGIVVFLATIWLTRRLMANEEASVKDSFYKGMFPLVPFILLLLIILIQLVPLALGNFVLSTVINNSLASTTPEVILWVILFIVLALISLYMVVSSVVALNIVTLPDVTPLQALRSSKKLVLHRRLGIIVRLLILPIILLLLSLVIFVPLIAYVPILVEPLFLIFSSFWLIYYVVYLYNFYRELL